VVSVNNDCLLNITTKQKHPSNKFLQNFRILASETVKAFHITMDVILLSFRKVGYKFRNRKSYSTLYEYGNDISQQKNRLRTDDNNFKKVKNIRANIERQVFYKSSFSK